MRSENQPYRSVPAPGREKAVVFAILALGILLRVLFCATNDPRHAYDDHFHVIRILYEEHRIPRAEQGWQTYQPPLYHMTGAVVYGLARLTGDVLNLTPEQSHALGRKAIQWISSICGIVTLLLVWRIVCSLPGLDTFGRLVGVSFAALLPGHIYMCGMATNDSMTCMWITVSVWALLQCIREPTSAGPRALRGNAWAVTGGLAGGLAMLTKHSGLAALLPILLFLVLARRWARKGSLPGCGKSAPAGLATIAALTVGCYPYVRDMLRYGTPIPSNYDLVEHTIRAQPPGHWRDVSFFSFRFHDLWARPWLHLDQADSFWTQMYGGLWFDHSTAVSLWRYTPWKHRFLRIWGPNRPAEEEGIARQLSWTLRDVPPAEAWQGRLLYLFGLLPTALVIAGIGLGVWAARGSPGWTILMGCLAANWAVPVFQVLRQPHYSSMKAAFALGSISAMAAVASLAGSGLRGRRLQWASNLVTVWMTILAAVVVWHLVYLGFFPPLPGEPFDPL